MRYRRHSAKTDRSHIVALAFHDREVFAGREIHQNAKTGAGLEIEFEPQSFLKTEQRNY